MAREAGASVLLLKRAPKRLARRQFARTRATCAACTTRRRTCCVEAYPEEEYWQDLLKVTGGPTDETLARLAIRASSTCRDWMRRHGVHFQPPLSGALHLSRTNAFFMGGGKALVNAYYRSAEALGVRVRYDAPVDALELAGRPLRRGPDRRERIEAQRLRARRRRLRVQPRMAARGLGPNERGEWPADNFLIRGTRFNQGVLLKFMIDAGADTHRRSVPGALVAIDARAPLYDGGICTRIDCVSLGVVVNREGERFYDEGEDFWPKRYAIWGRLVAQQPGQIGYSIIDCKAIGRFMPPVFPGTRADTLPELARALGLPEDAFMHTLARYNAACRAGTFDHTALDDCATEGLVPAKTHWARPIDTPPLLRLCARPGITFTYLGLKVNERAAVHFGGAPSDNLFVAGEMMAGNVLGKGYTAGVGMSIGTAFGRIAGSGAAAAALEKEHRATA